jgi:hypothetical protein
MKKLTVLAVLLIALGLSACSPAAEGADLPSAAVLTARAWLAERLGVTAEDIVIQKSEQVEWSDGCLELGGPAESCLAAITSGWLIEFEVNGDTYKIHTDENAVQIRLDES